MGEDNEIHHSLELGEVLSQGFAVTPLQSNSSDSEAQIMVRLQIPAAEDGFIYAPAELTAQIIEFNRTSPARGIVVQEYNFTTIEPSHAEENLIWEAVVPQVYYYLSNAGAITSVKLPLRSMLQEKPNYVYNTQTSPSMLMPGSGVSRA